MSKTTGKSVPVLTAGRKGKGASTRKVYERPDEWTIPDAVAWFVEGFELALHKVERQLGDTPMDAEVYEREIGQMIDEMMRRYKCVAGFICREWTDPDAEMPESAREHRDTIKHLAYYPLLRPWPDQRMPSAEELRRVRGAIAWLRDRWNMAQANPLNPELRTLGASELAILTEMAKAPNRRWLISDITARSRRTSGECLQRMSGRYVDPPQKKAPGWSIRNEGVQVISPSHK